MGQIKIKEEAEAKEEAEVGAELGNMIAIDGQVKNEFYIQCWSYLEYFYFQ